MEVRRLFHRLRYLAIENFKGKIYIVPGGDEEYRKIYLEKIKGEVVTLEELRKKLLEE